MTGYTYVHTSAPMLHAVKCICYLVMALIFYIQVDHTLVPGAECVFLLSLQFPIMDSKVLMTDIVKRLALKVLPLCDCIIYSGCFG